MKLDEIKLLLEFLGYHETKKTYDKSLLYVNAYYVLFRKDYDFEILINEKGVDARCQHPWRPETDWNDLFMLIDKICNLSEFGYKKFFESISDTKSIIDVYKEIVNWIVDYFQRIKNKEKDARI